MTIYIQLMHCQKLHGRMFLKFKETVCMVDDCLIRIWERDSLRDIVCLFLSLTAATPVCVSRVKKDPALVFSFLSPDFYNPSNIQSV